MAENPAVPLAERVRPRRWTDLIGNARAVFELRRWAESWRQGPPTRRAALLEGPPGIGKTSAALVVAREMSWGLVEMNASDARNRRAIEEVVGRAALTSSLDPDLGFRAPKDGGRTLLLLDEADCLSGRASDESAQRAPHISFREFLRGRYQRIEALNDIWGLGEKKGPPAFAKWDDVPATGGRGAWARRPAAQRDLSDWREAGAPRDVGDRGGLGAIAKLVKETRQPMILTVNDSSPLTRYSPVFRFGTLRVRFTSPTMEEVKSTLRRVVLQEGIALHSTALDTIVKRSEGDIRGALNDLEAVSLLPPGPNQGAPLGTRERGSEFESVISEVFSAPRVWRSVELRDRLDATPDDLFPWIDENLPAALRGKLERSGGYDRLATAERLLAFARRRRMWGLWSFATELMTGGVALAAEEISRPTFEPRFPSFLAEMGRARTARALSGSVRERIKQTLHLSRAKASEAFFPLLERTLRQGVDPGARAPERRAASEMVRELGLSADEIALLTGREPGAPQILALVPDSSAETSDEAGGVSEKRGGNTAVTRQRSTLASGRARSRR